MRILYILLRFLPVIIPLVLLGIAWLTVRHLGWIKPPRELAPSASRGSWTSRIAEAVILACAGTIFLALMMSIRLPRVFAKASPEVISFYTIIICCIGGVALLGVLVTLLGRTKSGFFIMVVAGLCGFVVGAGLYNLPAMFGIDVSRGDVVTYGINVNGDLAGVDVWINGVYLGKTPIRTTLKEFTEKVPYRPEPPAGSGDTVTRTRFMYDSPSSGTSTKHRWVEFRIPEMPTPEEFVRELPEGGFPRSAKEFRKWSKQRSQQDREIRKARKERARTTEKQRTYYAQFKFGDASGYGHCSGGGGLGSSSTGGRTTYRAECNFDVYFPLREQRIKALIDKARQANYNVESQWFEAMGSYGPEAWDAVRKVAYFDWLASGKQYRARHKEPVPSEPGLLAVMDAWARWKFDLDKADNEYLAWEAFEKLWRQVDVDGRYSTASMAGRAVKLLVPELDARRLVKWVAKRVKRGRFRRVASSNIHKKAGFFETRGDADDRGTLYSPMPSDYLAIDAIWRLDELLDERDDEHWNIVEQEVSKAIVAWHGRDFFAVKQAVLLDGPGLKEYLLRHWQQSKRKGRGGDMGVGMQTLDHVNKWLFLLASMQGEAGREMRTRYADDIMEMARKITQNDGMRWGYLDFLGFDLDMGPNSLGARFWPQFQPAVRTSENRQSYYSGTVGELWSYLVLIEPIATVDMFVDSWRESTDYNTSFSNALDLLDGIPAAKQEAVLRAVQREVLERPENITKLGSDEPGPDEAKRIIRKIDDLLARVNDQWPGEYLVTQMKTYGPSRFQLDWLVQMRSGTGIGEMMSQSEHANVRRAALELLRAHPAAANIKLLQTLSENDKDPSVRSAAQEAVAELTQLAEIPIALLAADTGRFGENLPEQSPIVSARLYADLPDDPRAFTTVAVPVSLQRRISGVDNQGRPVWKVMEMTAPEIDAGHLPRDLMVVLDPADQDSPEVIEMLGATAHLWQLNARTKPSINHRHNAQQIVINDALGQPILGASAEITIWRHGKYPKTIILTGHQTDDQGQLTLSDPGSSAYQISRIKLTHRDYGIAEARYRHKSPIEFPIVRSDDPAYARALHGVVLGPDGQAIGDAVVRIDEMKTTAGYFTSVNMEGKKVYTDQQGRFSIYPSGQNVGKIPLITQYRVRVDAPKSLGLLQYVGYHQNGAETKIIMEEGKDFRTFAFEDEDGPITDPDKLSRITVTLTGSDDSRLDFKHSYWANGNYFPLGRYTATGYHHPQLVIFEPVTITQDSPKRIIFRELPRITFRGRVIHGVTGRPMAGAFVMGASAGSDKHFSEVTLEEWNNLHLLPESPKPDAEAIAVIRRPSNVKLFLRTDPNGYFSVERRAADRYSFLAFEEDYMPLAVEINSGFIANDSVIVDVPDIKLFPAAKVRLALESSQEKLSVAPLPIIDPNDSPEWASAFRPRQGCGPYVRFSNDGWYSLEKPRWIYVPAHVRFKLQLRPGGNEWSPLTLPNEIFLHQGETLDLGSVSFEQTVKVKVKVISAEGAPLEGIRITKIYHGTRNRYILGNTDDNGLVHTTLEAHSKGNFAQYSEGKGPGISVPFEVGGQEDAGRTFELVLPR